MGVQVPHFPPRTHVVIKGLKNTPQFNGRPGVVADNVMNAQGKIQVEVDGELCSIFPANLNITKAAPPLSEDRDPRRILFIVLTSFIAMIAASYACDTVDPASGDKSCEDEKGYAVAVAVVSLFVSTGYCVFLYRNQGNNTASITRWTSVFMLVWWTAGAFTTTFRGPFASPGNGYFVVWLAFIESFYFAYTYSPMLRTSLDKFIGAENNGLGSKYAGMIMAASFVLMCQSATDCDDLGKCENQLAFALAVSVISLFVTVVYVLLPVPVRENWQYVVSFVLGFFWFVAVWVVSFDPANSPYIVTGNGYISTWVAFAASMAWAVDMLVRSGIPTLDVVKASGRNVLT